MTFFVDFRLVSLNYITHQGKVNNKERELLNFEGERIWCNGFGVTVKDRQVPLCMKSTACDCFCDVGETSIGNHDIIITIDFLIFFKM